MRYPKEYLLLSIVLGITLAVTGCVVHPSNQNQSANNTQNSTPVDISDFYNSSASYAIQRLQARSIPSANRLSHRWWLNSKTNQCFQRETANGKVITLNSRTSQDLTHHLATNHSSQLPLGKEKA